jgi:VWFA-related protein
MGALSRYLALIFAFSLTFPLVAQETAISPPSTGAVIQVHVNVVLVPVVVRDAQGRAIGDLKESNFKVFDQGKLRPIAGFTLQQSAAIDGGVPQVAPPSSPEANAAGAGSESLRPSGTSAAPRVVVLLFDDRHLSLGDLGQSKKAALQMLEQPLPDGTRVLVLSFLGVNSGLTHNRVALEAAVEKLKARQISQQSPNECPDIDYYAADQILNKHSRTEYGIAMEKAAKCLHLAGASANGDINVGVISKDPAGAQVEALVQNAATLALQNGDTDARETLGFLRDVVHSISVLPGERTIVLISPGFLSLTPDSMEYESQVLNFAAGDAVTISTLDARGLYGTMMSASQSGDQSMRAMINGRDQEDRDDSMRQNKQIMAELADGTGGTFFRNNNDLAGGLSALAAGPEYKYLLEISLQDVKQNGAYHSLKVEVDRKDVKLQARSGYFAPLPRKNRK